MTNFTFGIPQHEIREVGRRVRVLVGETAVADTDRALLLTEKGATPRMFVPVEHIREGSLQQPGDSASGRLDLRVGDMIVPAAVMQVSDADDPRLAGHVWFDPGVVTVEAGGEADPAESSAAAEEGAVPDRTTMATRGL